MTLSLPHAMQFSVPFFRQAAPYIRSHQHKTMVIALASELIASPQFKRILSDIAILSTLGIKLILVHGVSHFIDQDKRVMQRKHQGIRITDEASLQLIQRIIGEQRVRIEHNLGFILNTPPIMTPEIGVVSGNFIIAKPIGIRQGVDFLYSGKVRKLQQTRLEQQLAAHNIVLLSPLGFSPTGVSYNLHYHDVAVSTAKTLQADKLIFISSHTLQLPKELTLQEAQAKAKDQPILADISQAIHAGVSRVHLLDGTVDGSLLLELFTQDGIGTLISDNRFETIQAAKLSDISAIIDLIRPLEKQGLLIERSREQLELEIDNFVVMKRDDNVIACAALYPIKQSRSAELACFVVDTHYRGQDKGDLLLKFMEEQARQQTYQHLLVLTTQAIDWFQERGFDKQSVSALPEEKKQLYNYQRNSQVLCKPLI